MTVGAGPNSFTWHENVNPQNFNEILVKTWKLCTACLENSRGIYNADVDDVPTVAKA